jgi:hypothetical protein
MTTTRDTNRIGKPLSFFFFPAQDGVCLCSAS